LISPHRGAVQIADKHAEMLEQWNANPPFHSSIIPLFLWND